MEDSIKLFRGTKLYGLPIVTKYYSEHLVDPVFHEQLNSYKRIGNVNFSSQSNVSNISRLNNQNSNNKIKISKNLAEVSIHYTNTNQSNFNKKPITIAKQSYKEKPTKSRRDNSYTKSCNSVHRKKLISLDKSCCIRNKKSENYRTSDLIDNHNNNWDTHHYQTYDHKQQNYNIQTSTNWNKSSYQNQEFLLLNENNRTNEILPVRDLRDTLLRKHGVIQSDYLGNTNANATCTSLLDLRDTMYHNKTSENEDLGHHESDFNNWWLKRNYKNSRFSEEEFKTNSYTLECHKESSIRYNNHFCDGKYENWSFNKNESNYDGHNYTIKQNWSNNIKYNNHIHPLNMKSSDRQYNSYHPYKRNSKDRKRKK